MVKRRMPEELKIEYFCLVYIPASEFTVEYLLNWLFGLSFGSGCDRYKGMSGRIYKGRNRSRGREKQKITKSQ